MPRTRHSKLTFAQAEEIRVRGLAGEARADLAREFGVTYQYVRGIVLGLARTREHLLPSHDQVRARNKARFAKWYAVNGDQVRAASRAYRAANPGRVRTAYDQWYKKNAETVRVRIREYAVAHPEQMRLHQAAYMQRRRARLHRVESTLTLAEWRDILFVFDRACAYCLRTDRKLTMDHVIPVSKGGTHTAANIVPACGPCNSRKGARGPLAMLNQKVA